MSDFGISKVLSNQADVDKVLDFLLNDMGVEDERDLPLVEERDFIEAKILGKAPARRLIELWKEGL